MYMPADFEVTDEALLHGLMQRFGFATLVTVEDGRPLVSHLPLLLDRTAGEHGTLLGHMARANHQWESFAQSEALAIFQGEHGYVSPSWYEMHPSVPTWNYLVVHAHGPARIVEEEGRAREILAALVARHERGFEEPWTMELPEPYLHSMVRGIVAFEMPLTRLEGKFKLSQNRPRRDQLRVIATLAASADPADQALAAAMRTVLGGEAE